MKYQRYLQAIAKAAQAIAQTKALSKSLQSQRRTKLFLKNFPTLQKNKKRHAQPETDRENSKQTMIPKPKTDNGLQGRTTEGLLPTAVWRNGGFSASYDSLVVCSSAVLRLNFSAINPRLRQARNHWFQTGIVTGLAPVFSDNFQNGE